MIKLKKKNKFLKYIFRAFIAVILMFVIFALSIIYSLTDPSLSTSGEDLSEKQKEKMASIYELMVSISPTFHYRALTGDVPLILDGVSCLKNQNESSCSKNINYDDFSLRIRTFMTVFILIIVKIFMIFQLFKYLTNHGKSIFKEKDSNEHKE